VYDISKAVFREFTTIQKGRRIQLKREWMDALGWKEKDQLLIEEYKGRLIIENLSKGRISIVERLK